MYYSACQLRKFCRYCFGRDPADRDEELFVYHSPSISEKNNNNGTRQRRLSRHRSVVSEGRDSNTTIAHASSRTHHHHTKAAIIAENVRIEGGSRRPRRAPVLAEPLFSRLMTNRL